MSDPGFTHPSDVAHRANAWFNECGITVRKVLTDNGSYYRTHRFRDALGDNKHRRTCPHQPQTNGRARCNYTVSHCSSVTSAKQRYAITAVPGSATPPLTFKQAPRLTS